MSQDDNSLFLELDDGREIQVEESVDGSARRAEEEEHESASSEAKRGRSISRMRKKL